MAVREGVAYQAPSSFSSVSEYGYAILDTPGRLCDRALAVSTLTEEMTEVKAMSGAEMTRNLRWWDVIALGVGGMVGAGIFVSTGSAARLSGPAVVLAYLVAGISALLSALCYTEFAVEMPVAGGAFSYLRITFGEFPAFIVGANLLMEYVLSNAAVARSFTSYAASAYGVLQVDAWRLHVGGLAAGYNQIDLVAVSVVMFLTVFLCCSTKKSSVFNLVMTVLHMAFILFIIIAGFVKGDTKNLTHAGDPAANPSGFVPMGIRGILGGAAIVYFSYIGFDSVSTTAEEVKNPAKNMPIGVSGSVVVVTVLYSLIAVALCMLQPYDMIDIGAPFSTAFQHVVGWEWATNFIGVGASLGIITSLLVAMLGQARYMCVLGRAHIVPQWFAVVNSSTGTPINATVFLGGCTAAISLFTDLTVLLNLISIGTLFVFYMVANALIYRRHHVPEKTNPFRTIAFLTIFSVDAVTFVTIWQFDHHNRHTWALYLLGGLALAMTTLFWFKVPTAQKNKDWSVPCMPWVAAASIFLNVFLLGSVDRASYVRFVTWTIVAVVFYLLYGVHSTYDGERARTSLDTPLKEGIEFEKEMEQKFEGGLRPLVVQVKFESPPWIRVIPSSFHSVTLVPDMDAVEKGER
ncbi:cationic amino acid transporter 6, chloroplastic [Physcomitrium patens]|uniref:Cationic amino acid transporter C-terminal domain-containing protein n=1 Tax=Physcomitrium patens TaxID=3218 RepID=A0A2K1KE87_PHYPA|nr:cationic amino acid transporter 6, chloroplastic-like [Physcomitrium patens]PNR52090.1 hypothetical protein PHYPA_008464 [Physcomitrium patens]|eukprot:XP_024377105.1 cationic amino acid transporter 6, chloroplastic-like [Physcomitrella patens]